MEKDIRAMVCSAATIVGIAYYMYLNHPESFHFREKRASKEKFQKQYGSWGCIVGASKGLGAEWAVQLAKRGLNLVLIARNRDELKLLASHVENDYRIETRIIVQDVGLENWKEVSQSIANEYDVGLLVYNAAYIALGRHVDHQLSVHMNVVDVNVKGLLSAVDSFLPKMREKKKGGLVFMSSVTGQAGAPIHATYGSTKAFISCFSESLWAELLEENIDVLGVILGVTSTPTLDEVMDPKTRMKIFETHPRTVVEQSLRALGRVPLVTTGLIPKIAGFMQWILPPRIRAKAALMVETSYKSRNDLVRIALEHRTDKNTRPKIDN